MNPIEVTNKSIFSDNINQKIYGIVKYLDVKNDVYFTNLVLCPIFNKNTISNCLPRLYKEIELVNPEYIICLGSEVSDAFNISCVGIRGQLSLSKFFSIFTVTDLKTLFYLRDKVKLKLKDELDQIKRIMYDEQNR